jgi:hypothetical protein
MSHLTPSSKNAIFDVKTAQNRHFPETDPENPDFRKHEKHVFAHFFAKFNCNHPNPLEKFSRALLKKWPFFRGSAN